MIPLAVAGASAPLTGTLVVLGLIVASVLLFRFLIQSLRSADRRFEPERYPRRPRGARRRRAETPDPQPPASAP